MVEKDFPKGRGPHELIGGKLVHGKGRRPSATEYKILAPRCPSEHDGLLNAQMQETHSLIKASGLLCDCPQQERGEGFSIVQS